MITNHQRHRRHRQTDGQLTIAIPRFALRAKRGINCYSTEEMRKMIVTNVKWPFKIIQAPSYQGSKAKCVRSILPSHPSSPPSLSRPFPSPRPPLPLTLCLCPLLFPSLPVPSPKIQLWSLRERCKRSPGRQLILNSEIALSENNFPSLQRETNVENYAKSTENKMRETIL